MLEETTNPTSRAALSPAQRATPASIDLIALCSSLPADGHLSKEDLEVLKDWTARYHDIPLPAQRYVSGVVDKALTKQVVTADDRQSLYEALEPALPVQLRKATQEQRLLAELAAAEREGSPFATISMDFLVGGVHAEDRWRTIQSHVRVGDAVRLVRHGNRSTAEAAMSVVLADGRRIGLVPKEDARTILDELDRGGRVEAVVKKILTDGQFPVPVIGCHVHCIASDDVVPSESVAAPREPVTRWPVSKLAVTMLAGLAGAGLLVWAVLTR